MKRLKQRFVALLLLVALVISGAGEGALASLEMRSEVLTASDGARYRVTLRYDTDAGIPADAALEVRELSGEEYEDYARRAAETLDLAALSYGRIFDIAILDPDGGRIQPDEAVEVEIRLLDGDLEEYDRVEVVHFPGEAEGEGEIMPSAVEGDAVAFETDGFSVYVLAGYTVDFHWGDYSCSIPGESEITLSELLEKLNVTEISLSDVSGVSFSDPALIEIQRLESDWLLRSLAPFETEEALYLSLTNGETVAIRITDDTKPFTVSNFNNAEDGDVLVFSSDYNVDDNLDVTLWKPGITVTIDLGGHTLSVKSLRIESSSTLIVRNGTISAKNAETAVIDVYNGSPTLVLGSGLTVNGNVSNAAGTIEISGATVNGSIVSTSGGGHVTVTEGTVTGNVSVSGGKLTVSGGTVGGNVSVENSTTTITGGKITGDLTVTNQTATISGGEFDGAVRFTNNTSTVSGGAFNDRVEFTGGSGAVTGGEFNGAVSFNNNSSTVSGGSFTGTVSVTGTGTNITGGTFTNAPSGVVVATVHLTITAASASKVYDGTALTASGFTSEGLAEGDTITGVTVTGSQTAVGESYNVPSAAVIDNQSQSIYVITYVNGTLTVTGAGPRVTVTVDAKSKVYGDADPDLTATVEGLAAGDTISYSLSRAEGAEVGSYPITANDLTILRGEENVTESYIIDVVTASLTVDRRPVTVTAESKTKAYGEADPLLTATVEGLVGDDTINYSLSRAPGENVGDYAITVTGNEAQGNYTVTYVSEGTLLRITKARPVVTPPEPNALIDSGEPQALVSGGSTSGGTLLYSLDGVDYAEAVPTATAAGNYTVYYKVEGGENYEDVPEETVAVRIYGPKERVLLTITAGSAEKTYDGEALMTDEYTVEGLLAGHRVQVQFSGSRKDAGTGYSVPHSAIILDENDQPVTDRYVIRYVKGTLTVRPAPVTLRANSGTAKHTGEEISLGYTPSVEGLRFADSVRVTATYAGEPVATPTAIGMYLVNLSGVSLNETTDLSGNYVVTATEQGLLIIEGVNSVLTKAKTGFEGNRAYYQIVINPDGLTLNDGDPYTLRDNFANNPGGGPGSTKEWSNQSINYRSVRVRATDRSGADRSDEASWDYSGYTGTFSVPDETAVTITYYTRVKGEAGDAVPVRNCANLGLTLSDGTFLSAASASVAASVSIEPDVKGAGGVYTIDLLTYAQDHMEEGLAGAVFRLLDENKRPMTYPSGEKAGEEITFTTGANGWVTVGLNEATDGLSLHKNTVYYLEMTAAPYTYDPVGGDYVYYQMDNTYYSFLISDNPDYTSYGQIYSYYNGDTLKVRCYPETPGVSAMLRFSGNYELTEEQRNAITFTLQKEAPETAEGWVNVLNSDPEKAYYQYRYEDFEYGHLDFNIPMANLEKAATYRIKESNELPGELEGIIDCHITVTATYQVNGIPVENEFGEFFVDPDDSTQVSYSFVFTNEYVDHRLSIVKVNELSGALLPGAEFSVYEVGNDTPVKTYTTTDANGRIEIKRSDDAAYQTGTLYYAVETDPPENCILPEEPERIWFYFSDHGEAAPEGLPAGAKATDLTRSYNTVAVLNESSTVDLPVTVSWGLNEATGDDAWPASVSSIVIGLYQSVDGGEITAVTDGGGNPRTVTLTREYYYNNYKHAYNGVSFTGLPALEGGKRIRYSVQEIAIMSGGEDILSSYAQTGSVSGTGWYIVNNRGAVSVKIQKAWYEKNGDPVSDASGRDPVSFDLYRTTTEHRGLLTRDVLEEALEGAEPVRRGLSLSAGNSWELTVPSLEATDAGGQAWYYFALEHVPDNQIDSYTVTAAAETEPRTLIIQNQQTPSTVTVTAGDLVKIFGMDDPDFTVDYTVSEVDGSTPATAISGSDGAYTITIDKGSGDPVDIHFTVSRDAGEDVGAYAITPAGDPLQSGYRVLYKPATLTVRQAEVVITAGGTKVYGDADPALTSLTLNGDAVTGVSGLVYSAAREDGEDVGSYPITLSAEENQGNYHVRLVTGALEITPASVTVTAKDCDKRYGEDDPDFEALVSGMKNDDAETMIEYELTRPAGESVGTYTITPEGEALQGNYTVTFETGTLTIERADLTVRVEDADKTYGDGDPEWIVEIDGLRMEDDGGTAIPGETPGSYIYRVPGSESTLLSFQISREAGENAGDYAITVSGGAEQDNYSITYETGSKLTIYPAELTLIPNHTVKARMNPPLADPLLTASFDGLVNGDVDETGEGVTETHSVDGESGDEVWTYTKNGEVSFTKTAHVDDAGNVTWTYRYGDGIDFLNFTLRRAPGEDEGEYEITAPDGLNHMNQRNYLIVNYETGTFSILSMLNVEVSQRVEDPVIPPAASPSYQYTATVDLQGSGLIGSYNDNGFTDGIRQFTLTGEDSLTLQVPAGARLSVARELVTNDVFSAAIEVDGAPYSAGTVSYTVPSLDDFYAIRFVRTRITLPLEAAAGGTAISGSGGYIGIPAVSHVLNTAFAETYQTRIGYTIPSDYYYVYDGATLYQDGEEPIAVAEIGYDWVNDAWKYRSPGEADNQNALPGARVVLRYEAKHICRIGTTEFYTLNEAMEYIEAQPEHSAFIEMLLSYPMPASDMVTVPEGWDVTITTAPGLETTTAVISRREGFTVGGLFTNLGSLTLDNIILDGQNVAAESCMVASTGETAKLTVKENAVLRNAIGQTGAAVYVSKGTALIEGSLTGNRAARGAAVYAAGGEITLSSSASVTGNEADYGGALYLSGGTLNLSGTVSGNKANYGGAQYFSGGTVNLSGTVTGNKADSNGGAIYLTGGTLNVSGSVTDNKAANGGAVFLTGGTVNIDGGTVSGNIARASGGGFYIEGGAIQMSDGTASGNTAAHSGGLVYGTNGTVSVSDGTVSGNTATLGNGGAICYGGGGSVTIAGGSFTGNGAANYGGALCLTAGTATLSGGTLGGDGTGAANTAKNGAAVYVADGAATFSGVSITKNSATEGGAVGVGSLTARLHFSGDTVVKDNTRGTVKSNVYLDLNSDQIINSAGLGSNANIGIYVSDALLSTRGDACTKFGTYDEVTDKNVGKFVNDRSNVLKAYFYNYHLIWTVPIQYSVRYLSSFADGFPPAKTGTQLQGNKTYYPHHTNNPIYDLITEWAPGYSSKVANYVYAYSFANGASGWDEFLTGINWDAANQKWVFQHGETNVTKPNTQNKLVIYYSEPSYLSITNNSEHSLTIDTLTVLGENVVTKNYGYPTVVDYLTQRTLVPIADSDVVVEGKIVVPSFGYVKLLFPGACTTAWSVQGRFADFDGSEEIVNYTLDSLNTSTPKQPLPEGQYEVSGNELRFSLNGTTLSSNQTYDILFEDPTPICKIVDANPTGGTQIGTTGQYEHPFSTLKGAWQYIVDHAMTTATIQMLVDYQQRGNDVLEIDAGYDITVTTAIPRENLNGQGERVSNPAAEGIPFTYRGDDISRATISRDNTNNGAAIIAEAYLETVSDVRTAAQCDSSLTVTNLIFDGKALAKSGNGGAISTCNNNVLLENCVFKGYTANRGGAVFIRWGGATIQSCDFYNCTTNGSEDKTGGGAIWTTAQVLTITDCNFDNCACVDGKAQGGAIFHNIRGNGSAIWGTATEAGTFPTGYSAASRTVITGCTLTDCYTKKAAAGAVETDALEVIVESTSFIRCYSENRNGGAFNIYAGDKPDGVSGSTVTVTDCEFTDCWNPTNGGAIRCTAWSLTINGCTFTRCHGTTGGAIAMTYEKNNNLALCAIYGCSFDGCYAKAPSGTGGVGGAISAPVKTLIIGEYNGSVSTFNNCTSPKYGGVYQNNAANGSTATVTNASFTGCVSSDSEAGALYTAAKTLNITGSSFQSCTATKSGGAVYHTGTSAALTDSSFTGCVSGISGGGAYFTNGSLAFSATGSSFTNCTAVNSGGGLYLSALTETMSGCKFYGNSLSATDSKGGSLFLNQGTATLSNITVGKHGESGYSTAVEGGGVYHSGGTLYLNSGSLSGCYATGRGGALYTKADCYLGGHENGSTLSISRCYAAEAGGGVYHSSNLYPWDATVTACYAKQGGGVYSANYLETNTDGLVFRVTNCHAKNVSRNADGTVNVAEGYSSDNLGGGVYRNSSSGDWNLDSGAAAISGCSAYNGGGVYYGNAKTFWFKKGSITGNTAQNHGGGVYLNAGTINMSGGTVSDNSAESGGGFYQAGGALTLSGGTVSDNSAESGGGFYKAGGTLTLSGGTVGGEGAGNTAANGAGVFVDDGQALTVSGGSITHNSATALGGGVAVGGSAARLFFQGAAVVQHNTMSVSGSSVECNVYLDQDSNAVVNTTTTALGAGAYIGVYCSDEQDPAHGLATMPFGTYNKADNLDRFKNDRRPYYYGVKGGTASQIVWSSYVCKITDGAGNLLYKDMNGTPAVYQKLENNGGTDKTNAFGTLANANPGLYQKDEDGGYSPYTGSAYQVQMLVQDYQVMQKITVNQSKTITLTTASAEEDVCGLFYNGDQKHPRATILRSANYGSMISLTNSASCKLKLTEIILDGGSEQGYTASENGGILYIGINNKATIGANATLRNSNAAGNAGAGVRMQGSEFTMDGGTISNCQSTGFGGGVSVKSGTFYMNGGSITDCEANYGGGVRVDTKMVMSGGSITGNNATTDGGGISVATDTVSPSLKFSGSPVVTGNTLKGTTACNVQLSSDSNTVINASAMNLNAEIGVYVPGVDNGPNATASQFDKHGGDGDDFGTWSVTWTEDAKPYVFVNDRNNVLRGSRHGDSDDPEICWAQNFLLTVSAVVDSDLTNDHSTVFTYHIRIDSNDVKTRVYSDYRFNSEGVATLTLREGQSVTIHFPDGVRNESGDWADYTVWVDYSAAQNEDFTTTIKHNGVNSDAVRVTGTLGENLNATPPSGRSYVEFTHHRRTGDLEISKTVESQDAADKTRTFSFELQLGESVSKSYPTKNAAGVVSPDGITFDAGRASFTLTDGESLTVLGLPTDLSYTLTEDLSAFTDTGRIRTKIAQNGGEAFTGRTAQGTVAEGDSNRIAYTNSFLEIICKIMNRSRSLLYYKESDGKLVPAVFDNLAEAFALVNRGGLRTVGDGSVSGQLRIEMVVPEYTMQEAAELAEGKNVILTTARYTDTDPYPYNRGDAPDTDHETAAVTRGGDLSGSMITDRGALTLDEIVLDGGKENGLTAAENGGIVQVVNTGRLTVNAKALLRNARTTGNGGAIWLGEGTSLTMNGELRSCEAAMGGGVYCDTYFSSLKMIGAISGCAAESGGGIYASATDGGTFQVNGGAHLSGNSASADGGGIWSATTVLLRGEVRGNSAHNNGGGLYLTDSGSITVYSTGRVEGNSAGADGGGLYTEGIAKISGGKIVNNEAVANGGGLYAGSNAAVTIATDPSLFSGNKAKLGGAVYVLGGGASYRGKVTMSAGSMYGNTARIAGGAVYAASGGIYSMSGGVVGVYNNVGTPNNSPEGAISTAETGKLFFSESAKVLGNTGIDGETTMNVYLGYLHGTDIINTTGLKSSANIGVYVADGDSYAIYFEHGIADRNFGTYLGTAPWNANLDKFHNDRDKELNGFDGEEQPGKTDTWYAMWPGKNLYLRLRRFDVQMNNGKPIKDEGGNYVPVTNPEPVSGARFTLTRIEIVNGSPIQTEEVWAGVTGNYKRKDADGNDVNETGMAVIPWSKIEATGGNTAIFGRNSYYVLEQKSTDSNSVLPGGSWLLHIQEGNIVSRQTILPGQSLAVDTGGAIVPTPEDPEDTKVNRTCDIAVASGDGVLGDVFLVYNDRLPKITFLANGNGATLSSNNGTERTERILFRSEKAVDYVIREGMPVWNRAFLGWNTEAEGPGDSYTSGDHYRFYRHTDYDDLTLYARWDDIVCKITDPDGRLCYLNGQPAVYASLEKAFEDFADNSKKFYDADGNRLKESIIKMLVGTYKLTKPITLDNNMTVTLTTAGLDPEAEEGYASNQEVCTILRDYDDDASMITMNRSHLTLKGITLDGGAEEGKSVSKNGGIVHVSNPLYKLRILEGATLRNSVTTGKGGAVYATPGATVIMTGGAIEDNSAAQGAGIYLDATSSAAANLNLSGSPVFSDNTVTIPSYAGKENGEDTYPSGSGNVHVDIYLAEAAGENQAPASITLTGDLGSPEGSIWVWANSQYRYQQFRPFALLANGVGGGTLNAFRNARADDETLNETNSYLYGTILEEDDEHFRSKSYVSWIGGHGFDVLFRKVDGTGTALPGATFALYNNPACDDPLLRRDGSAVTATSADGTTVSSKGTAVPEGAVLFEKVPEGVYYMKETAAPTGYVTGSAVYLLLVGQKKFSDYAAAGYGLSIAVITEQAGSYQNDTDYAAFDLKGDYAIFLWDVTDPANPAAATVPNIARDGIVNRSSATRKVILRKVDGSLPNKYQQLSGATFNVYRANGELARDDAYAGAELSGLTSDASGIFWTGFLSYGTYYLEETAPQTRYFELRVDEKDVRELKPLDSKPTALS